MQQTENSTNYLGTLGLLVLVLFLVTSFPGNSKRPNSVSTHSTTTIEMSTVPAKAISAEAVVLPSANNSCLTLVSRPVYSLFSHTLKVANDNVQISQKLAWLKRKPDSENPFCLSDGRLASCFPPIPKTLRF